MNAETDIRALVTRWVDGIRACDLDAVTGAHADDIVMFDVPPPYEGIRGITAYRASWPPFFEFISSGATFELLELDVVAGDDVAFAYGLLRCGGEKEFAENPDNRLRLSMGLRRVDGRWQILHEHHSFPDTTQVGAERGN
ncbi:glyoxalase [Mycobacterium sp. Root265]|uniref:YybH family protein n=1 Tax=Mycobacterium sp. Root265 TaxID=1736504 RepID=UPI000709D654|nr:nuclear transport factor 2 family protein [Mycobacterium sp. Root265]KRD19684.1 glyoxalase [Mycobacterium sp. Root265]